MCWYFLFFLYDLPFCPVVTGNCAFESQTANNVTPHHFVGCPLKLLPVEGRHSREQLQFFKMTLNLKRELVLQNIATTLPKWLHFSKTARCCLNIPWQVWCTSRRIFERDLNCVLYASLLMHFIHLVRYLKERHLVKYLKEIFERYPNCVLDAFLLMQLIHLEEKFLTLIV